MQIQSPCLGWVKRNMHMHIFTCLGDGIKCSRTRYAYKNKYLFSCYNTMFFLSITLCSGSTAFAIYRIELEKLFLIKPQKYGPSKILCVRCVRWHVLFHNSPPIFPHPCGTHFHFCLPYRFQPHSSNSMHPYYLFFFINKSYCPTNITAP